MVIINGYFLIFQCTRIVIACCVLHNIRKETEQREKEVEGRIEDEEDNEEMPHEADGQGWRTHYANMYFQ